MHRRIETRGLLYVPQAPPPASSPLLCFLHGVGESAEGEGHSYDKLQRLFRHGSPVALAAGGSPLVDGCIVLAPQLPERRRWLAADAEWVDLLVSAALRDHRGDPARMLLTGFSNGGEGAFQLASASRHRWSALWAVDPALQAGTPSPPPGARVLVHHGTEQPGAEHRPSFSQLIDQAGGTQVALAADHVQTCRQAYSDAGAYARLLGAPAAG